MCCSKILSYRVLGGLEKACRFVVPRKPEPKPEERDGSTLVCEKATDDHGNADRIDNASQHWAIVNDTIKAKLPKNQLGNLIEREKERGDLRTA